MSDPNSPVELISQLTKLNEKIIQYGALILGENKKLSSRVEALEIELKKLESENKSLRKGLVTFSEN